jgi:SAM-dependent methyltransferase/uncharacterized protein YbaR (Trm112 family)
MTIFRKIGLESVAWSLRRLYCPVGKNALVLEVGSGGNPYSRSNVLLDAYESTRERHWVPLKSDRPTILGFAEKLPFRDKSFDFVIASHVLEHSSEPGRFLSELQRVAKAGYIEVPDAFLEHINPYRDHRLEVTCRDNTLIIRKKNAWVVDKEAVELYEHKVKKLLTVKFVPKYPFAFHVRYYWEDTIAYTIMNPEVQADWPPVPSEGEGRRMALGIKEWSHNIFLGILHFLQTQKVRNYNINIYDLLICPECKSGNLVQSEDSLDCTNCHLSFVVRNGMPVFNALSNQRHDEL